MSDYHILPAQGSSGRKGFIIFKGNVRQSDPFLSRELAQAQIELLRQQDRQRTAPVQPLLNPMKNSDLMDSDDNEDDDDWEFDPVAAEKAGFGGLNPAQMTSEQLAEVRRISEGD